MTTLQRIKLKAENDRNKMPSLQSIHNLLNEYGILHQYRDSMNVVEYRSKGKIYVNSRHNGKEGKLIEIDLSTEEKNIVGVNTISMNSADSYYSCNTWGYARSLAKLIEYRIIKLTTN